MKKWYLLFLPLLLIGAGCAGTVEEEVTGSLPSTSQDSVQDTQDSVQDAPDSVEDAQGEVEEEEVIDEEASDDETEDVAGNAVSFNLSGENFAFDTATITVQKGDTVTINFASESGFHDWTVDELNAATSRVNSGESTSVTFVADTAGSFEYYCSVGNHRAQGMVGTITVK
jgi:plastocyanin